MQLRTGMVGVVLLVGLPCAAAVAATVPFSCNILPGAETGSVMLTNSLGTDGSCIVTCKYATTKYDNNPQITCAKPVPAGKEVEMCEIGSGGDKMVKLINGRAECSKLP